MVAVFTLRRGAGAATAAAGVADHESLEGVEMAGVVDQASVVVVAEDSLVAAGTAFSEGVSTVEEAAVSAHEGVELLSVFSVLVSSEGASVLVASLGRPFLSPPFKARGAPLVAPPRALRNPSRMARVVLVGRSVVKDHWIAPSHHHNSALSSALLPPRPRPAKPPRWLLEERNSCFSVADFGLGVFFLPLTSPH